MSRRVRSLFALTVAILSAACSGAQAPPSRSTRILLECPSGSIETPEQAEAFASCGVVGGDLAVHGMHLFELSALSELVAIGGTLVIADNPNLENLRGLERLGVVGGLELRNNGKLDSIASLEGLMVAGHVSVIENPNLRSLAGLERLERLERLELRENGLYDARGLEGLEEVGELVVARNRSLISLRGLENVRRAGELWIHENPRLCGRLGFLPGLERVEGELHVTKNWGLTKSEILALHARVRHDSALFTRVFPSP